MRCARRGRCRFALGSSLRLWMSAAAWRVSGEGVVMLGIGWRADDVWVAWVCVGKC